MSNTLELVLWIYLIVGALVGIPLAHGYWKSFRSSDHKANTILPKLSKIDFNRIVDSYVFLIAWIIIALTYPIYIFEKLYKNYKERKL